MFTNPREQLTKEPEIMELLSWGEIAIRSVTQLTPVWVAHHHLLCVHPLQTITGPMVNYLTQPWA